MPEVPSRPVPPQYHRALFSSPFWRFARLSFWQTVVLSWRWVCSNGGMILTGGSRSPGRKPCPSATSSTKYITRTDMRSNPGLRVGVMTNHVSKMQRRSTPTWDLRSSELCRSEYSAGNNPEERSTQLLRGGSLIPRMVGLRSRLNNLEFSSYLTENTLHLL